MSTVQVRDRIRLPFSPLLRVGASFALLASVALAAPATRADDLPHARVHPTTGHVETVEPYDDGTGDLDVRHILDDGTNSPVATDLATGTDDERGARIEIDDSGRSLVFYWRDVGDGEVLLRRYDPVTDKWSGEYTLNDGDGGLRPETVNDGSAIWYVYEEPLTTATGIVVGIIEDGPDPLGNVAVDSTSWTGGDVDPRVHAEDGHVWVTWVDDADDVGWSEYDAGTDTWSSSDFEDYSADSVALARKRIRDSIVDP